MSGAIKSTCPTCGEIFASVAAFDFHRVGPYQPARRRCLTSLEMLAEGMNQDDRGWWALPAIDTKQTNKSEKSA
jgi:hypothetical protein